MISKIDAPCECLGADLQKDGKVLELPSFLKKGEEGRVVARFKTTGFRGVIDKDIFLKIGGQAESLKLTVRLHVPEVVEVSQTSHAWILGSPATEHTFKVTMNYTQPVEIISHSCSNPAFTYKVETVKKGKEYLVKVTPRMGGKPELGVLTLNTNCPIRAYARRKIFLVLKKEGA